MVGGVVVTLKFEQRRDLQRTEQLALEHARHWATVVSPAKSTPGPHRWATPCAVDFWEEKIRVLTLNRAPDGITGIVKAEERRTTTFGHSTVFRCFAYDIPATAAAARTLHRGGGAVPAGAAGEPRDAELTAAMSVRGS
ncbi:hypothetical protein ACU686_41455 [Yinghuangia aomiensis]